MGIFDFVKEAGAKLIGSATDAATSIHDQVAKQKLDASDVNVVFVDGTVKLSGSAATQADKEKLILAAGNIAGVSKVDDNITVAQPAAQSRMYTVKSGDTLSAIAKAMYGNANDYPKIFEANKPMLSSPDKIYPGQLLRIP
ncbi:peptidoglycan-binding protein LysM [Pseudolysobacter antarcticus]|uniref:Potassium binding protein Kbp n=1 Tax=Pseudolysobacter antarcticus TaxID=2511995 RepID=A0A411HN21_9GAMM|nr:peptidoglycan-binding protein LysM [Pseudolysobacter antarcticus]QBB71877.1 peptidoglycan-binding protein LysM [Pseudolysobacter antarcticus]